jgi:hypothetical protein
VAHAATRRSRATGDEAGHLAATLGFVDQELRGLFFRVATDFTDHDDRLGFVVGQEQFQHVDEVGAVDRSPPMPTAVVWPGRCSRSGTPLHR